MRKHKISVCFFNIWCKFFFKLLETCICEIQAIQIEANRGASTPRVGSRNLSCGVRSYGVLPAGSTTTCALGSPPAAVGGRTTTPGGWGVVDGSGPIVGGTIWTSLATAQYTSRLVGV